MHRPLPHLAEVRHPAVRADRHEVDAGPGIVVTHQADGAAVMALGVVEHVGISNLIEQGHLWFGFTDRRRGFLNGIFCKRQLAFEGFLHEGVEEII